MYHQHPYKWNLTYNVKLCVNSHESLVASKSRRVRMKQLNYRAYCIMTFLKTTTTEWEVHLSRATLAVSGQLGQSDQHTFRHVNIVFLTLEKLTFLPTNLASPHDSVNTVCWLQTFHKTETIRPKKLMQRQLARTAPIFSKTSLLPQSQLIGRESCVPGAWPDDAADVLRRKAEHCQMVYCGKLRRSTVDIGLQNSSICQRCYWYFVFMATDTSIVRVALRAPSLNALAQQRWRSISKTANALNGYT